MPSPFHKQIRIASSRQIFRSCLENHRALRDFSKSLKSSQPLSPLIAQRSAGRQWASNLTDSVSHKSQITPILFKCGFDCRRMVVTTTIPMMMVMRTVNEHSGGIGAVSFEYQLAADRKWPSALFDCFFFSNSIEFCWFFFSKQYVCFCIRTKQSWVTTRASATFFVRRSKSDKIEKAFWVSWYFFFVNNLSKFIYENKNNFYSNFMKIFIIKLNIIVKLSLTLLMLNLWRRFGNFQFIIL